MNSGSKGLIHIVRNDFGIKAGQSFLMTFRILQPTWFTGFSVGIGDLVADSKTNERLRYDY